VEIDRWDVLGLSGLGLTLWAAFGLWGFYALLIGGILLFGAAIWGSLR